MKNDKNDITFLHYVEKIIRKAYPDDEKFIEELEQAQEVAKVSIEQLSTDSRDYSQSVKNVEASVEIGNLSDSFKFHPSDKILSKVLPVIPHAKKKAELLTDQAKITMSEFESLLKYFGEDPSDVFAKNSFFKKFVDFVNDYKKAKRENIKREEEERIYEQRKRMMESSKGSRSSSESDQKLSEQREKNVMDALLEKLKAAGPAKGNPSSARKRAQARKNLMKLKNNDSDNEDEDEVDVSEDFDISPSKSKEHSPPSESNEAKDQEENTDDDVGARARTLLQELRGTNSAANQNNSGSNGGLTRAQQLRLEQRNKRKQSVQLDDPSISALAESQDGENEINSVKSEKENTDVDS
jgi:cytokinesis protein